MSAALLAPMLVQGPDQIPPEAIEITRMFFVTVAAIALGIPIIRAFTRRFERGAIQPPPVSPELTNRLERIEQAVDAVAIEVERIAESQRFMAKLMAEEKPRAIPGDNAAR